MKEQSIREASRTGARISRWQAIRLSATIVDDIAARESSARIDIAGRPVPLCVVLKNPLVLAFATAMATTESRSGSDESLRQLGIRSALLDSFRSRVDRGTQGTRAVTAGGLDALMIAREPGHFDALGPVAELITARGGRVRWQLYREVHRSRIATGERRVANPTLSTFLSGRYVASMWEALRAETLHELRLLVEEIVDDSGLGRRLVSIYKKIVTEALPSVTAAVVSLEKEVLRRRPDVVLVGNPATLEGRIGVELAARLGIPTLTIQHGILIREDPLWMGLPVDRFCVWGEGGRRILRSCGYDDERIAVTGDPARHGESRSARERCGGGNDVLVLLSGEGHMTGMDEHRNLVQVCVNAAALTGSLHWHFRLHRKDQPGFYEETIRKSGAKNCSVSPPGGGGGLGKDLERARVAVSTTSTAAIEALAIGVPVVSVERPQGEYVPEIVAAGLTTHVEAEASVLAQGVMRLHSVGAGSTRVVETARFLDDFFGADGADSAGQVYDLLRRSAVPVG